MVVSEAAASVAHGCGVSMSRMRVVHNGIDEPRHVDEAELEALRRQLGIDSAASIISVVARLRPEKGIDTLINAMPLAQQTLGRSVVLLVVGDGPESERLHEMANQVEADGIKFVGHKDDVAPWFRVADVVAVPSYREPFGLSALEAIACERPIVATAVGGLPEFIHDGVTGTLVPSGDPGALANALTNVLRVPVDAERMADAAYGLYRERFMTEAMVDGWLACYRDLLEG